VIKYIGAQVEVRWLQGKYHKRADRTQFENTIKELTEHNLE